MNTLHYEPFSHIQPVAHTSVPPIEANFTAIGIVAIAEAEGQTLNLDQLAKEIAFTPISLLDLANQSVLHGESVSQLRGEIENWSITHQIPDTFVTQAPTNQEFVDAIVIIGHPGMLAELVLG